MALEEKAFALELKAGSQPHPRKRQLDALNAQLEDVYISLQPTPQDYQAREAAVSFVNLLARDKLSVGDIRKELGVCHARAFGSFTMDMFTRTSDLDISLNTECKMESPSRDQKVKLLRKLTKVLYSLQTNGSVRQIQPVLKARVPVVKFIHCNTGLECDVSVENEDGIIKSEFLRILSSVDARFRKLCFLLKAWANAHRINSSKENTLNSLSIILLVAFHLQTRVPAIIPPFSVLLKGLEFAMASQALCVVESKVNVYKEFGRKNKESVAQLFNSFLTQVLAVKDLWVEGLCASAYEGTWKLSTQPSWMFVEDFTSLTQNAARSVNGGGFDTIYKCCNETLLKLKSYLSGTLEAQSLKSFLFSPLPMERGVPLPAKRKRPSLPLHGDTGNSHRQLPLHGLERSQPVPWGPVLQFSEMWPRHTMVGMGYHHLVARGAAAPLTGMYFPPLHTTHMLTGLGGEHPVKRIRLVQQQQQPTFVGRAVPQPQPSNVSFAHPTLPGVHSAHLGGTHGAMPPTLTSYPHQLYTENANILYQNMCSSHQPLNGYAYRANR